MRRLILAAISMILIASPAMAQSGSSTAGGGYTTWSGDSGSSTANGGYTTWGNGSGSSTAGGGYTTWSPSGGSSTAGGGYTTWSGPAQMIITPNGPTLLIPQQ
jgi:hypothetical protein